MNAKPVLFLIIYLFNLFSLDVADTSVGRRFEENFENSNLILKASEVKMRSLMDCGSLCDIASACQTFCYSQSTSLCYLSEPYVSSGQIYDGLNSQCYDATGCPMTKGYAWHGARCIKGYTETKTYTDARATCTQDGGHLYHFKDLEWDVRAIEDLRTAFGELDGRLWMGADDLEVQGQYKWSDSSLLADDSPVWKAGEPDTQDERCVALLQSGVLLVDTTCSRNYKFICQIDV